MDLFRNFGRFLGYKLNFSKSLLFPHNQLARDLNFDSVPFKLESDSFNYLGATVTHSYDDLYIHKFKELVDQTKSNLVRWSSLLIHV